MRARSVNKLEAVGLIAGPVLALVFFLLEPGGLFIQRADSGDAVAIITALAQNPVMAHVSSLIVPLGLVLMLYGLSGINRVVREDRLAAALSRLGILCMTVGVSGWILTAGLTHVLAGTQIEVEQALERAIPVYMADSGLTIISSMAVATGFLAFNLGLAGMYPSGSKRIASLVIAAVSVVALVALIVGHAGPNAGMITLSRLCYFPWVAWSVFLGVEFLRGSGAALTGETAASET